MIRRNLKKLLDTLGINGSVAGPLPSGGVSGSSSPITRNLYSHITESIGVGDLGDKTLTEDSISTIFEDAGIEVTDDITILLGKGINKKEAVLIIDRILARRSLRDLSITDDLTLTDLITAVLASGYSSATDDTITIGDLITAVLVVGGLIEENLAFGDRIRGYISGRDAILLDENLYEWSYYGLDWWTEYNSVTGDWILGGELLTDPDLSGGDI